MGLAHVHYALDFDAPIETVFERLVDHDGMASWPGISDCWLEVPGEPRNGLGALRIVKARGLKLYERIVHYSPPTRFDYQIEKGLPVAHLGTVRLRPNGGVVHMTWDVRMSSRVPLLAQVVGGMLQRGLPDALAHVKRGVEQ